MVCMSELKKKFVVEGPIGVGKSSLAKRLAASFGAPLLLEQPVENPFLEGFYNSPERFALPTQLSFLLQRVRQLKEMKHDHLFTRGWVADFMLEKDRLFAQITLNEDELRLYQDVYQNVVIERPQPDLVIYLQAPVDVLLERIHRRRVKYEMGMDQAYLHRLSDAYTNFFHRYNDGALLIVNATEINPINNDDHYTMLLEQLHSIEGGKHFFNPLA